MSNNMSSKTRIDLLLVEKGLVSSRNKAQALIMAGKVLVNETAVTKSGALVRNDANIRIKGKDHPFVSRGGLKIQKALDYFSIDVKDKIIIDVGASTGGFTDCVLQRGAKAVHALDVGYGQLDWKIRNDSRVIVWEKSNIRNMSRKDFNPPPEMAVMDVSFISITKIISVLREILQNGPIISLVKPQFEVGKGKVGKGGVVRDEILRENTVKGVISFIENLGATVEGPVISPIKGPKGNVEYLIYIHFEENSSL